MTQTSAGDEQVRGWFAGRIPDGWFTEAPEVTYDRDPVFNIDVPNACPDVPEDVLKPRHTWASPADYDTQAAKLARMFVENFKTFEGEVSAAVKDAGPRV